LGQPAFVSVGALSRSGKFRAVLCEQMTFGHLARAVHEILEALGGTPRVWRTDRMATAVVVGSDRLNPQFAQMAKHYGVDELGYLPMPGEAASHLFQVIRARQHRPDDQPRHRRLGPHLRRHHRRRRRP
jgi:hypothetical protein